jgi:hypothetical protein
MMAWAKIRYTAYQEHAKAGQQAEKVEHQVFVIHVSILDGLVKLY